MKKVVRLTESQLVSLVKKILNEDLSDFLNRPDEGESSYERFMDNYSQELYNAVKKLRQVTPEMIENLSEEEYMRLGNVMKNYDKNVQDSIEHMIYTKNRNSREVATLAIENSDRYGTEPQFVIYAIDDYTGFFGIHDEEEDDEE